MTTCPVTRVRTVCLLQDTNPADTRARRLAVRHFGVQDLTRLDGLMQLWVRLSCSRMGGNFKPLTLYPLFNASTIHHGFRYSAGIVFRSSEVLNPNLKPPR